MKSANTKKVGQVFRALLPALIGGALFGVIVGAFLSAVLYFSYKNGVERAVNTFQQDEEQCNAQPNLPWCHD